MKRSLALVLVTGATLALGATGAPTSMAAESSAFCLFQSTTFCPQRLNLDIDGAVTPKELPRGTRAPVALEVRGRVSHADGSHPPALRQAVVDIDRHGAIDATGLPACALRQIRARSTVAARRVCRGSIVGRGVAHVGLATPEPISVRTPLTLFNGGVRDGVTRLFVHGTVMAPIPVPLVSVAKISRGLRGRYGLRATWTIPRILDGRGSLLAFRLKVERRFNDRGARRSYLSARCVDGRLHAGILSATFRREASPPRTATVLKGTVVRPCVSKFQAKLH